MSAFGSSVQCDPVPAVPKKKNKRVTISCKDHYQDDDEVDRLSVGVADIVVNDDEEDEEEDDEDDALLAPNDCDNGTNTCYNDEEEEEDYADDVDEIERPVKRSSREAEIDMSQVRRPYKGFKRN